MQMKKCKHLQDEGRKKKKGSHANGGMINPSQKKAGLRNTTDNKIEPL